MTDQRHIQFLDKLTIRCIVSFYNHLQKQLVSLFSSSALPLSYPNYPHMMIRAGNGSGRRGVRRLKRKASFSSTLITEGIARFWPARGLPKNVPRSNPAARECWIILE